MPKRSRSRLLIPLAALAAGTLVAAAVVSPPAAHAGDLSQTLLLSSDEGLRAQGMDYAVQQIDYFGRDGSHATARWIQQEFRWVENDTRRGTSGDGLTFLVDESWTETSTNPLDLKSLAKASDRAGQTWRDDSCLSENPLRETPYPGGDVTVFDYLVDAGGLGDPFAADIVIAGLAPGFESLYGDDVLAFAVTFVFVDGSGTPTDADADGYLDTALSEIYLNPAVDWSTGGTPAEGAIDLETALLHELGHALGLGHFGSPPESVMMPVYTGVRHSLFPIDHAALCLVYARNG